MLAQEAFDSSTDRTWGKVYEPKLVRLSGLTPGRWSCVPVPVPVPVSVHVRGVRVRACVCVCLYIYAYVCV